MCSDGENHKTQLQNLKLQKTEAKMGDRLPPMPPLPVIKKHIKHRCSVPWHLPVFFLLEVSPAVLFQVVP